MARNNNGAGEKSAPDPTAAGVKPAEKGSDTAAGDQPDKDPEPASTAPDAIVRPVTFPPAPHKRATHEIVRPITGLPYQSGDRVDASGWRTVPKLERLRYIRRLSVSTHKEAEALNARLSGLVKENQTLKARLDAANEEANQLRRQLEIRDAEVSALKGSKG